MTSDSSTPEDKLGQATAEKFIRFLWVAFNNVSMYGTEHPLAKKGVENYHSLLQEILERISPITLHVEGENLLCEKWKTSQSLNVGRLVERLRSAGINSISFQKDVAFNEVLEMFRVISDAKNYQNIDDISQALNDQDIQGIGLNTFIYKRVSVEEAEDMEESADTGLIISSSPEQDKKFEDVVENLMGRFFVDSSNEPLSLLDQLEILRERFISEEEKSLSLPTDELLDALMYLKSLKSDETDMTLDTGHVAKPGKEILFELELLTFELVKKFVQDKYNSEELSPKQFGWIIRNLFFDPDDLKILFPQIKEVLMTNGMTLSDYLEFVHETSIELEAEGFLNLMEQIGGDIGISVSEISEELKKDPYIPVQLIILTFKIFTLLGIDSEQIISVLSQSVGLLIQDKTLENVKNNKDVTVDELKNNISRVENKFLSDMENEGVNKEFLQDIKDHLDQRSNILTGQVWSEWVIGNVSENKELSDSDQIKMLAEIINQNEESKSYINNLLIVMEEKGYKKELLDDLMSRVSELSEVIDETKPDTEVKPKKPVPLKFPEEISNQKETKKYLQLEIYRNHRHKTSFSCISISVNQVNCESEVRPPIPQELAEIFLTVAKMLTPSLRKIDFLGSLGSVKDNYLLVIMTMTDKIGCQKVEERIASLLNEISIKTNGSVLVPDIFISSMSFEKEETPEIKTIVRRVKANHRKKLKLREKPPAS